MNPTCSLCLKPIDEAPYIGTVSVAYPGTAAAGTGAVGAPFMHPDCWKRALEFLGGRWMAL